MRRFITTSFKNNVLCLHLSGYYYYIDFHVNFVLDFYLSSIAFKLVWAEQIGNESWNCVLPSCLDKIVNEIAETMSYGKAYWF